jgi:thioredoxin-like negative regulator of GroEL
LYVYCLSGPRSNEAAKWLTQNGFILVVDLKGGLLQWRKSGKPLEKAENIPQMSAAQFQEQLQGKNYVLVDFGADWCPPCRKMEPDVNLFLSRHPEISFLKIDAGVHTGLMKQLQVNGIPTLVLMKKGSEVWRNTGILDAAALEVMWNSNK